MKNSSKHIALVLFTRSLQEERGAKDLFVAGSRGSVLYDSLIKSIRNQASFFKADFFEFNSAKQQGETFSERLNHTFRHFFKLGYQKVILIGNDCPSLNFRDFQRAEKCLEEKELVIGPTQLGGVYLIGLTKSFFYSKFQQNVIAWNTGNVYQGFIEDFGNAIGLLQVQKELNGLKDLDGLISHLSHFPNLKNILLFFEKKSLFNIQLRSIYLRFVYVLRGLRAPPTSIGYHFFMGN